MGSQKLTIVDRGGLGLEYFTTLNNQTEIFSNLIKAKWWHISCIPVRAVEARVVDEGGVDRGGKLLCKAPWQDWLALAENVYCPPLSHSISSPLSCIDVRGHVTTEQYG